MSTHKVSCDRCGIEFCYEEELTPCPNCEATGIADGEPCECCDGYGFIDLDSGVFLCEECKGAQESPVDEDEEIWSALCGEEI